MVRRGATKPSGWIEAIGLIACFVGSSACALSHRAHGSDAGAPIDDVAAVADGSGPDRVDVPLPIDRVFIMPDAIVVDAPDVGCPVGQALCGGTCIALDRPDNCGGCGNVCPVILPLCSNVAGTFVCSSGCSAGETRCGATCVNVAMDPMNCRACGTVCPLVANGSATCMTARCGIACNGGYHLCGTRCARDDDPSACGPSCAVCDAMPPGVPVCVSNACMVMCPPGAHRCGTGCAPDNDATQCGASCSNCPRPPNGTATCVANTCSFLCNAGFTLSGGACVASLCGNGAQDAGETCDDGNAVGGDGCSASCAMEASAIGEHCSSLPATTLRLPMGTSFYSGTTVGHSSEYNLCGGSGPDVILVIQLPAGRMTVDIVLTPVSTLDIVLRAGGGADCPGSFCRDMYYAGGAETATFTMSNSYVIVVDGFGSTGGGFRLNFNVR